MYEARTDIKLKQNDLGYGVCGETDDACGYLLVISDRKRRRIPISEIQYIESCARKLTLHLEAEEVSFYGKLCDVEPILEKRGFVRTHQSYMVRISKIEGMGADCVSVDGIQIPVSRRYYRNVKEMNNIAERE